MLLRQHLLDNIINKLSFLKSKVETSNPLNLTKVFSNELKELEMNGFIKRTINTSTPVVVEYELTEYSNTLQDVMQALSAWGAMHRETIKKGMQKAMQHKN